MFCNPDRISGSKLGGINLARRRKRKSRRRQEGRKILEHIPQFSIDSDTSGRKKDYLEHSMLKKITSCSLV